MMSNIEYVRDLLVTYPGITSDGVHIDFIGMTPTQYSIRAEPTGQIIKKYLNGDTMRRFSFALEGICDTISDADRAQNNALFERLALWLERKTRARQLPVMRCGAKAMSIEATGGVYMARQDEDGDAAVYMMQIELNYYQKARKE
jgi:hypothetical protein